MAFFLFKSDKQTGTQTQNPRRKNKAGESRDRKKRPRKPNKKPKKKPRKNKKSSRATPCLQALRFPKSKFTKKQARAWARKKGYKAPKAVQAMKNFWSIRQKAPKHFKKMWTKKFSHGVTAIVGF